MSNRIVPKPHKTQMHKLTPFATVSNRIVPKHHNIHNLSCTAFVPVSNETVPKPRNSLFSFQQLTINISSPIVVTRA